VAEPVRRETVSAEVRRPPEPAPVVPTFQSPAPVARAPEPVIHVAEERYLEPIVDPWVEAFEQDHLRPEIVADASSPVGQGDLYLDRTAAGTAAVDYPEPSYDERDHRKSGWSLFGKKPRSQSPYAQPPAPAPAPVPSRHQPQAQLRQTAQSQPGVEPRGAEDDLEIPSFLRRLAN
ncbi:MAG: hypothetical protein K2X25_11040, partial [Caulobacteraceae bacterium]|nr:hypothetical protein [Caulobacteraceae bacterium]